MERQRRERSCGAPGYVEEIIARAFPWLRKKFISIRLPAIISMKCTYQCFEHVDDGLDDEFPQVSENKIHKIGALISQRSRCDTCLLSLGLRAVTEATCGTRRSKGRGELLAKLLGMVVRKGGKRGGGAGRGR